MQDIHFGNMVSFFLVPDLGIIRKVAVEEIMCYYITVCILAIISNDNL